MNSSRVRRSNNGFKWWKPWQNGYVGLRDKNNESKEHTDDAICRRFCELKTKKPKREETIKLFADAETLDQAARLKDEKNKIK